MYDWVSLSVDDSWRNDWIIWSLCLRPVVPPGCSGCCCPSDAPWPADCDDLSCSFELVSAPPPSVDSFDSSRRSCSRRRNNCCFASLPCWRLISKSNWRASFASRSFCRFKVKWVNSVYSVVVLIVRIKGNFCRKPSSKKYVIVAIKRTVHPLTGSGRYYSQKILETLSIHEP